MRRAAGGTQSARLDDVSADGKAAILAEAAQAAHNRLILYFLGGAAIVANHELALVRMLGVIAGDKRAHTFDFMDELVQQQKIERAINRRRPDLSALILQSGEQRIRTDRLIGSEDQLEHASAYRRQAPAARGAEIVGASEGALNILWSQDSCQFARGSTVVNPQCYSPAAAQSNKAWWTTPRALFTLD